MSTYNGWKNYDTWATIAHLTNDEVAYHAAQDAARRYENDLSAFADVCASLLDYLMTDWEVDGDGIDRMFVDWGEIHDALVEE